MAFTITTPNTLNLIVTLVSIRTLINDTHNSVNHYNRTQNNDTQKNGTRHMALGILSITTFTITTLNILDLVVTHGNGHK